MDSLEQEFQKLVDSLYEQIQRKLDAGEITQTEADNLRLMVDDRLHPVSAWDSSGCSIGQEQQDDFDQDGWNSSSWCAGG